MVVESIAQDIGGKMKYNNTIIAAFFMTAFFLSTNSTYAEVTRGQCFVVSPVSCDQLFSEKKLENKMFMSMDSFLSNEDREFANPNKSGVRFGARAFESKDPYMLEFAKYAQKNNIYNFNSDKAHICVREYLVSPEAFLADEYRETMGTDYNMNGPIVDRTSYLQEKIVIDEFLTLLPASTDSSSQTSNNSQLYQLARLEMTNADDLLERNRLMYELNDSIEKFWQLRKNIDGPAMLSFEEGIFYLKDMKGNKQIVHSFTEETMVIMNRILFMTNGSIDTIREAHLYPEIYVKTIRDIVYAPHTHILNKACSDDIQNAYGLRIPEYSESYYPMYFTHLINAFKNKANARMPSWLDSKIRNVLYVPSEVMTQK
ncbi:MAG: hypothetical protein R3A45_06220 [Bdellovibrionota bacterium]